MELVRCGNGHYYDKSKGECPICSADNTVLVGSFGDPIVTYIPQDDPGLPEIPLDVPLEWPDPGEILTGYVSYDPEPASPVDPQEPLDENLVVGWLVCLSGAEKGKSYRLHTGTNFIGRGEDMDVCIKNDQSVSTRNHASVSYDERERVFYITKGEVRNPTYLNGKSVRSDADLRAWDKIEVGATKLMFVPLCSEKFDWRNERQFCHP